MEQIDITTTPVLLAQYTWGLDLSRTLDGAGGIGGLLAAVDTAGTASTSDDRAWWYTYDANGNVGQLLRHDAGTGAVTLAAAYEYDPYGNTLRADDLDGSGSAQANKFRFSTKYLHDELTAPGQSGALAATGLYYYGYRFYSPGLGRWISRDPIEEDGGLNLNAFLDNNALSDVDPLGTSKLAEELCGDWEIYIDDASDSQDTGWVFRGRKRDWGSLIPYSIWSREQMAWKGITATGVKKQCQPVKRSGCITVGFGEEKNQSIDYAINITLYALAFEIGGSESTTKTFTMSQAENWEVPKCSPYAYKFHVIGEWKGFYHSITWGGHRKPNSNKWYKDKVNSKTGWTSAIGLVACRKKVVDACCGCQ